MAGIKNNSPLTETEVTNFILTTLRHIYGKIKIVQQRIEILKDGSASDIRILQMLRVTGQWNDLGEYLDSVGKTLQDLSTDLNKVVNIIDVKELINYINIVLPLGVKKIQNILTYLNEIQEYLENFDTFDFELVSGIPTHS